MQAISVGTDDERPQASFPAPQGAQPSCAAELGSYRGVRLEAFVISDSLIGTTPVSTRALHGAPSQETPTSAEWRWTEATRHAGGRPGWTAIYPGKRDVKAWSGPVGAYRGGSNAAIETASL